ncbi:pilus assembly FimT family protein [Cysteiniphilum halobium]|uniref:pilus assembly FimT family protein n=1 Tax=Cysteiniphilum halobium TaxID=2219059 RepID=UPI000E64A53C|nr:hypothetical protein [Cysteiniphilum halobium]
MNYIKYNFNQKADVRKNQQGYILISLMASLVILGIIAINEYMHLVKKQQLDRAETAATQIVSVINSIGDAIYEPMEIFNKNNTIEQDITKIWTKWYSESKKNGGWVTLKTFYNEPHVSAVCGISRPPVSQTKSFRSCVDANNPVNWSSNNGNLFCQCTNQKIAYAGFLNLEPSNIMLQPIGEKNNETPKSVLLRVPYPELGGIANSGLALRMLAHIKKNLIDTPRLKFAVCMGELKNSLVTRTQFACDVDVDLPNAFDSTHLNQQFIYIHIERKV